MIAASFAAAQQNMSRPAAHRPGSGRPAVVRLRIERVQAAALAAGGDARNPAARWGAPRRPRLQPAPDVLPAVAGAGATAGLQVAPGAAPDCASPDRGACNRARPQLRPRRPRPGRPCHRTSASRCRRGTGRARPQPPARGAAAPADEAGWPRSFTATGVAFEVHEPQVQRWDGAVLVADAAVVAHPDGQRQPVPGIVRMTARTVVDKAAGTVAVEDLTLTDASFPTARDREPAWLALLRNFAPRSVKRLSLAHLEASARQATGTRAGARGRAGGGASHHRGQEPGAAGAHRWRAPLRGAAGDQAAGSAQHPRGAAQGSGRQAVPARV